MEIELYFFLFFAFTAVVSGTAMILQRNLVYCVLLLIMVMVSLAGLFLMLNAQFVAVIQIVVYAAVITTLNRANGNKTFQPIAINWSYRNRGKDHRTQIYMNKNTRVLQQKAPTSRTVFNSGLISAPDRNGICHPPKNNVAIRADAVVILAYSAIMNMENFILLYSV